MKGKPGRPPQNRQRYKSMPAMNDLSRLHGSKRKKTVRWDSLTPTQLVKTLRDRDLRVAFAGIQGSNPERALKILQGNVRVIACDQHANNALLLDRGNALEKFPELMPEVVALTAVLATNKFGNYVLQSAIDLCYQKDHEHLQKIKNILLRNFEEFAVHEIANFSLRKFIDHGDEEIINRVAVAIKLIADTGHGNHVVQDTLRKLPNPESPARQQIVASVYDIAPGIANSKFGAHVIQALSDAELRDERMFLALKPFVTSLCNHENGNHVVRKIITVGNQEMLHEVIKCGDRIIENKWGQCVLRYISRSIDSKSPYFIALMAVPGINNILSSKQRFQADANTRRTSTRNGSFVHRGSMVKSDLFGRQSVEMSRPQSSSRFSQKWECPRETRRTNENRMSVGANIARKSINQPAQRDSRFGVDTVGGVPKVQKRKVFVNSRFRKRNQSALPPSLTGPVLRSFKDMSVKDMIISGTNSALASGYNSDELSDDSVNPLSDGQGQDLPGSSDSPNFSKRASREFSSRTSTGWTKRSSTGFRFSARASIPEDEIMSDLEDAPELCSSSPAPSLASDQENSGRTSQGLSPTFKSMGEPVSSSPPDLRSILREKTQN